MNSVLISIQPKWCELIASGKKTVEVRKTRPKLESPFKVYIYQTKAQKRLIDVIKDGDEIYGEIYHGKTQFIKTDNDDCHLAIHPIYRQYGKVIGEFVCDRIEEIGFSPYMHGMYICKDQSFIEKSCIPFDVMFDYLDEEYGYGWHISDLVIYDKPKELSEFYRHDNSYDNAFGWAFEDREKNIPITRPPQSWFYIEERSEGKRC